MCIGEAPGKVEEHTLIPLTGPTGKEYNELYLPKAGLSRADVYTTNTVKHCMTINRKPTKADIERCTNCSLIFELREVNPEVVVLMGVTACSLLEEEVDLEAEHGIPRQGNIFDWEGWVVPMWHPALGLHKTRTMREIMEDWEKLGEWLENGEWVWAIDNLEGLRHYDLIRGDWNCFGNENGLSEPLVAIDTETHGDKPYSLQFSVTPGHAKLVLLNNSEATYGVLRLLDILIKNGAELVFHNASADIDLVERLGITGFKFRDTMQEAYHLSLPQALKVLSRRLLGRKRKSWDETVTPPSLEALQMWLMESILYAQENLTVHQKRISEKTGKELKPKVVKSQAERVLTRILSHSDSPTYDPWKKLDEELPAVVPDPFLPAEIGMWPIKGIGHCSTEELVEYGCSDADDTLAVALKFEQMRKDGRFDVEEVDYDAAIRRN
jgi:uracil-DNA glycosylase family 4